MTLSLFLYLSDYRYQSHDNSLVLRRHLTLKADCGMDLFLFPFDVQICDLVSTVHLLQHLVNTVHLHQHLLSIVHLLQRLVSTVHPQHWLSTVYLLQHLVSSVHLLQYLERTVISCSTFVLYVILDYLTVWHPCFAS